MRAKNNRFYDKSRKGTRSPVAGWRLSLGVALVLIAALLTGCRGNQMDTQGEEQQVSGETMQTFQGALGYVFRVEGVEKKLEIPVDAIAREVTDQLPPPTEYFEVPACAGEGIEKHYSYDHFMIYTYPGENEERISSIILLDDMVSTVEGTEVGMTRAQIQEIYGAEYEGTLEQMSYPKGEMRLEFVLDGDLVVAIKYLK